MPCAADARLASQHKIRLQFHPENPKNTENPTHAWQLLLLNSALPARADGALSKQTLAWLDETLAQDSTPACIALHHHPLPVRSAWIDAHRLKNADDFWQIIRHHTHARLVLCGHVHQAQTLIAPSTHACTLLTCPAASRQFLPKAHDFALDTAPIGLRIIRLTARDFTSEIWRVADGVISVE
ncbi:3',5'-cyclic adenosine monophosphate phosphodiesterase CpdA [Moraxella caviae]|uniref:hypothetical protein n=1 Tax=Moraxella caviae TaxID=34060 RepID=UPI00101B3F20|nr:hypothetical protein [Moraxella caviae]VEW12066.1 3',5'-cyclic adenosine monophosphate phosphodiesterase CpdA [Moraxella caviae]